MMRVFTGEDQLSFAALSGDFNPIHVDAVAARRLMFGRPVVHGVHAVLWAMDQLLATHFADRATALCIRTLSVEFRSPMLVDDSIGLTIVRQASGSFQLDLSSNGNDAAGITLWIEDAGASVVAVQPTLPERLAPRELAPGRVKISPGRLPLHLDPNLSATLFPHLARLLDPAQFAALLATTRLVGMELPGLHSLYTGMELNNSASTATDPVLAYAVDGRTNGSICC